MHNSTRKKAKMVQQLVEAHYEEGRQDRCKRWIYRNYVQKLMPMSERTFWRYMGMQVEENRKETDERQLRLW